MKQKLILFTVFFICAYLLPLIGNLKLIISFQVFTLSFFSFALFFTQPPLSFEEAKQKNSKDRYSALFILGGCILSQLASVLEWAYHKVDAHILIFDYKTIAGLLLLFSGTIFRIWCIQVLGKYFTSTVKIQESQRIITKGAYSIVRHPSYLGAYLTLIGASVLLHASIGLLVSVVLMFIIYRYRIIVEEKELVNAFGEEYQNYQRLTKRFIPFVY